MTDFTKDARSIARLLGDAFEQLSLLIQTEIRLAKVEVAEKASRAITGIGLLAAGLLFMVPAIVLFLITLALFLSARGMSPVTAHLIAGLIGAAISAAFIVVGLGRLKPSVLTPDKTIDQVRKDIAAAKEIAR